MEVWIGLVEVNPLPESTILGDGEGAFVHALALASSLREYEEAVKTALTEDLLLGIEFQEVELFSERAAKQDVSERLKELADETQLTGDVLFDDFHIYESFDA